MNVDKNITIRLNVKQMRSLRGIKEDVLGSVMVELLLSDPFMED